MSRIERLTLEQEAQIAIWRDRWYRIGTCTDPANRARAERAITSLYAEIERNPPHFVWVDSPATAILFLALRQDRDGARSLWASLRSSLGASLRASLWDSLGASLRASLRASLWDSLRASLRASLWDSLLDSLGGQHEAYWIAFYRFCSEVLHVGYQDQAEALLDLWSEIASSCGWWWAYENTVIVSERPRVVAQEPNPRRPETYRLHRDDGPALLYRDGWAVYAWHGVRVPRRVIEEAATLTAPEIRDQPNAEVRRVMIERFGAVRYLQEIGATMLHRDDWGSLWRADLVDDEPLVMVEVTNWTPEPDGTFKAYWLRVHPELRPLRADGSLGAAQEITARNAVASTFGLTGEEYSGQLIAQS